MKQKNVKKNLLSHSEAKVKLLGEYLKRYLNIIVNDGFTKQIDVYDLFCGEGIYENGGEGSPIVIMRTIKDIYYKNVARSSNIPKINCYFNDIEESKVDNVKKGIADKKLYYSDYGEIRYSSKDYKDILDNLVTSLNSYKNKKAFIFIDPYEYKHIKVSHIKKLMSSGKSEVLLWLPTQFMYRFEKNGTPSALKDFIKEIVPFEQWKSSENVWKFVRQMKDCFQDAMGDNYFVDYFTIQKDYNTVFCLFFFTSHIKGYEKMLEAKWEIDTEQGNGWQYSGNIPSLFFDQKTNKLVEKIEPFLNSKPRTNGEVYEFTLRQGFLPKHTFDILVDWQQNQKIQVTLENGMNARKRSFYLNYKCYREDFYKITISI